MFISAFIPMAVLLSGAVGAPTPHNYEEDGCQVSRFGSEEFTNETVHVANTASNLWAPAVSGMNGSSWDYWYFEATGLEAKQGLVLAFWRAAPVAGPGQGPLRVDVYAAVDDGTKFVNETYFDESYIIQCPKYTRGVWNSSDGSSASFQVSSDYKTGDVHLDTKWVEGDWSVTSYTPARFSNNQPATSKTGTGELSPAFYWTEPIPAGKMSANLTLAGKKFSISGVGASDRNWAPLAIAEVAESWHFCRGVLGPYVFYYAQVTARYVTKDTYVSAWLYEDGEVIFSSPSWPGLTATNDYTKFGLTYGGKVEGSYNDTSTGYSIDFVVGGADKTYHFDVEHEEMVYQVPHNPEEAVAYLVNSVKGGVVKGKQFTGVGFSQENQFLGVIPDFSNLGA